MKTIPIGTTGAVSFTLPVDHHELLLRGLEVSVHFVNCDGRNIITSGVTLGPSTHDRGIKLNPRFYEPVACKHLRENLSSLLEENEVELGQQKEDLSRERVLEQEVVIMELLAHWKKKPQLRLGQLLITLTLQRDPFYIKDSDLLALLVTNNN